MSTTTWPPVPASPELLGEIATRQGAHNVREWVCPCGETVVVRCECCGSPLSVNFRRFCEHAEVMVRYWEAEP